MTPLFIRLSHRHRPYTTSATTTSAVTWSRRSALSFLSFIAVATLAQVRSQAHNEEKWVWSDFTSWDEALG